MLRRTMALVALSVGAVAACGDTDPPNGTETGPSSSTSTTQGSSDEQPDTYNDKDDDGESPHEG